MTKGKSMKTTILTLAFSALLLGSAQAATSFSGYASGEGDDSGCGGVREGLNKLAQNSAKQKAIFFCGGLMAIQTSDFIMNFDCQSTRIYYGSNSTYTVMASAQFVCR